MFGGNNSVKGLPTFLEDSQFQYDLNASTQLQLFGNSPATYNTDPSNFIGANNIPPSNQPNKTMEAGNLTMRRDLQISLNNFYRDEADGSVGVYNPNAVSTGLRLSYDDDERNSSRRQPEDRDRVPERRTRPLHKNPGGAIRKGSKGDGAKATASLGSIEKGVSRRIREKELKVESMNQRNKELAEQIKQAGLEARSWQCRARYNEYVVGVLRTNLEHAVAAKGVVDPEKAREGCGDSEVDDVASSYDPDSVPVDAGSVTCKHCGVGEACVLLLPCRHLCLCRKCGGFVDCCPVCFSLKTAGVEVYMS